MQFFRSLLCSIFLLGSFISFAQNGPPPPFIVSMDAVAGSSIPGLHSFAFARSGDKWLIIGGRTNGLHGLNSNDGFPPEFKNENVIVIDTTTWSFYSASLNQLSYQLADPMRSTNMEYIQDGNYLYMAGGFGYDSIAGIFVTFPILTAVHVDNMINAVINSQPIAPHVRQIADTSFAVCGGDLGKIGSDFYLCFGHNFGGRYTDPPVGLFTQQYTEAIRKFSLNDDGVTITISGMTTMTDTSNFHRRDLNVSPVIRPDGSFALGAYGGVFQKTQNTPFREPILITSSGTTVITGYQQVMSQYTCSVMPIFDSLTKNMYTTFFGGISLHDYDHTTSLAVQDTLVPFINDITTMVQRPDGTAEETVLPLQLNGLLGSNSKFVLNDNVAHYVNDVIHLRQLPVTKTLVGYLLGGIRAQAGNFGGSTANDSIYRIYITPDLSNGISSSKSETGAMLYPNPTANSVELMLNVTESQTADIFLSDMSDRRIMQVYHGLLNAGSNRIDISTVSLPPGVYSCEIRSEKLWRTLRLVISR